MPNKTIYIRKDDMEAYNKLADKIPEIISKALRHETGAKAKFEEVDTLLNGGRMVELATILGEPIYARIDLRDEVRAKAKVAELRSIIKDVVVGDTELFSDDPTYTDVEDAA